MRKKKNFKRKKRIRRLFLNILKKLLYIWFWALNRLLFISFASLVTSVIYFYYTIPSFEVMLDGRGEGSVTFLDKNDKVFALRGQQFDRSLRSETASSFLTNAIISSEDKNFKNHFGISPRGIIGAVIINLREGRGPFKGHGGSTITQQLAKLLCLMKKNKLESACRKQSLSRKILEIPFSLALEIKFSKDEILSLYMNRVYLGANTIGFEAASQRYFNKSAKEVSIEESAMLAALLKAPSRYAPINNLSLAQERAKLVIEAMLKEKYISQVQAKAAIEKPAELSKNARMAVGAHFADWIMRDAPETLTAKTTEDIIIKTTFDPLIQKHLEASVLNVFSKHVMPNSKAETAVVVMSANGDVLAMLGGRKNTVLQGQFNRAFQAYRQPGSAFKPFVYAEALQQGYPPDYSLSDTRKPPPRIAALNYWPKNYNQTYVGEISMHNSLANSVNTATVQLAYQVGLNNIINLAKGLGIRSRLSSNLSLALGSSEVSLVDLTAAYAGFLNLGRKVHPRGWIDLRLKSSNEVLIQSNSEKGAQVLKRNASKALISMLVSAVEDGTGRQAYIDGWNLAGKTGTSQNGRDAWFIGFSSEYIVGVWIGADNNRPLKGVVGGNLPSQIWSQIMLKIHADVPKELPTLSNQEYLEVFGDGLKHNQPISLKYEGLKDKKSLLRRFLEYFTEPE